MELRLWVRVQHYYRAWNMSPWYLRSLRCSFYMYKVCTAKQPSRRVFCRSQKGAANLPQFVYKNGIFLPIRASVFVELKQSNLTKRTLNDSLLVSSVPDVAFSLFGLHERQENRKAAPMWLTNGNLGAQNVLLQGIHSVFSTKCPFGHCTDD